MIRTCLRMTTLPGESLCSMSPSSSLFSLPLHMSLQITEVDYYSYHSFNANQTVIYPFHEACYEIFARYLFDDPDTSKIDKDILFSAMDSLCEEYARSLELDYGSIEGPEQTWDSIAGEEVILSSLIPTFLTMLTMISSTRS